MVGSKGEACLGITVAFFREDGMDFDLHKHFYDLMKEQGLLLCGHRVKEATQEVRTYIQTDYFCTVDLNKPYRGADPGPQPFAHFTKYNVVEVEGLGRTLDENRLRFFVGRTLVMEHPSHSRSRRGQISLTIVVVHKPVKLLTQSPFQFEQEETWKFTTTILQLPVTIIALRPLQNEPVGEALAWLKVLEPVKTRRKRLWSGLLDQHLTGLDPIKRFMIKMDEEAYMTIAEELRQEGEAAGLEKGKKLGVEQGKKLGVEQGKKLGVEQGKKLGVEQGKKLGLKKGVEQVACRMLRQGLDDNLILISTQLSREALARLKDELKKEA